MSIASSRSSTDWPTHVSSAAARDTAPHMTSGSGAPPPPPACLCHVSVATPMMHGDRGSTDVMPGRSAVRTSYPLPAALPSLALPVRRPLLGEGLRALLRILGLEDLRGDRALVAVRVLQVHPEAFPDALLRRLPVSYTHLTLPTKRI